MDPDSGAGGAAAPQDGQIHRSIEDLAVGPPSLARAAYFEAEASAGDSDGRAGGLAPSRDAFPSGRRSPAAR